MTYAAPFALDFREASLSLQGLLLELQKGFASWNLTPKALRAWSETLERYQTVVRGMPKAFRCHPLVKKSLAEIESFRGELQKFQASIKENSSREIQDWCDGLNIKVRRVSSLLAELESSALVQMILRGEPLLPNIKILQWRRKIVHMTMGFIFLYLFVYSGLSPTGIWSIAGPFIALTFLIEILRHRNPRVNRWVLSVFGSIMREGENKKINSAVFYVLSMTIVVLAFPIEVAMLTLLFIAVGDPLAGIVGTYWGKRRISAQVSWEGSGTCFIVCASLAGLAAGRLFPNSLTGLPLGLFSLLGGLIGAGTEASFKKLDDNLVMPLLSAPLLWVLMKTLEIL